MQVIPRWRPVIIILALAFLYTPVVLLVVYSFTDSRLATLWGGFTWRWYGAVFRDQGLIDAVFHSLLVATVSATLATALGTLCGLVLARLPRGKQNAATVGLVHTILVLPDTIIGITMLLTFVMFGLSLGLHTIIISHTTLTMCYVALVIQARVVSWGNTLEEAALDLGCLPHRVFFRVTLPLIWSAVVSGWLLAFTLSIDDLIITSFVSGPGSITLPVRLFGEIRLGVSPKINAVSTLLVLAVDILLIAAWIVYRLSRSNPPTNPAVRYR